MKMEDYLQLIMVQMKKEKTQITNDNDQLFEIKLNETAFYGWPDFLGNGEPVTDAKFQVKNLPPIAICHAKSSTS